MGIQPTKNAHPALAYMDKMERFRFVSLADDRGLYGAGALAEHDDCLEVHLEIFRFGPGVLRSLRADAEELKRMAYRLGKKRIVGLKVEAGPVADARWPKFTRLLGFTGQRIYQAAEMWLE
ncbi:hypothetical protein JCM14124_25660 [Humidesulfovibrio idahonensis]